MITDRARLRTYECDGLAHYRVTPALVVIPEDAAQLAAVVRACAEHGVPFVARGSGTGLSGGALPHAEGVLVVTSRMRAITEVRPRGPARRRRARRDQPRRHPGRDPARLLLRARPVEPADLLDRRQRRGELRRRALPEVRLHHQPRARRRLRDRRRATLVALGGAAPDSPGYDLLGAVVGSEGTLGIVTSVTVRLVRLPEEVRTVLVGFESTDQAGAATSAIIAAGIVPAAIEMMDALAIEAAEAAVHCNYPRRRRRGAGHRARRRRPSRSRRSTPRSSGSARENGAFEQRLATDPADRALIWKGRKSAFAAVGRISPDYIVQDGVIPRTALPEVLTAIAELSELLGRAGGQRLPRRRRQPAPAGALRRRRRGRGRGRREGQRRDPRPLHRARRLDHRRARRRHGQGEVHAADVHRRRPRHHAAGALRLRPATASPTPARSSRRRGCAARCPAGTRAPTRCRKPAWRRCSDAAPHPRPTAREAVASACADVHDASRRRPRRRRGPGLVARPADTEQVAEVLRAAAAHGLTVVPRGRGTKLSWGSRPTRADVLLDVAGARPGPRPRRRRPDRRRPGRRPAGRRAGRASAAAGQRLGPRRDRARRQRRRHARHQRQRPAAGRWSAPPATC